MVRKIKFKQENYDVTREIWFDTKHC